MSKKKEQQPEQPPKIIGFDFAKATEAPPEDLSYLPPKVPDYTEFQSLTDTDTRDQLEAKMIQTFLQVMESEKSSSANRLAAAKEIGELLGKYTEAAGTQIINGENVQINNIADDPKKAKHLLASLKNAKGVSKATDSGVRPLSGGKGV